MLASLMSGGLFTPGWFLALKNVVDQQLTFRGYSFVMLPNKQDGCATHTHILCKLRGWL